jgi:aminopeptidase N
MLIFLLKPVLGQVQEPKAFTCSGKRVFEQGRFITYVRHPLLEGYDVKYYKIDLSVTDTNTYIEGSASVMAEILQPGLDTIMLELTGDVNVDSIEVDRQMIPFFHHYDDLLAIPAPRYLAAGDLITTRVFYHGTPQGYGFFTGINNAMDPLWKKNVTYTLSESFHSKDWFPCKQVLTDKADSAAIFITVPPGRMAGSNGLLQQVTGLPDGRLTYEWFTGYPIAYYLLSMTVADYLDYSIYARPGGSDDSILVQNFIYNDTAYLSANRINIDLTSSMIELLSDLYGVYPFKDEKYGHCVAPLGGGMEHQTMTSLSGFSFDLVSHELGHQWFGDNVTCSSWQDIWINEGFASYTEYLCREFLVSGEEARTWMDYAHSRAVSEPDGSIYIPEEDADNEYRIFSNALSYKKGAAILHMIRYELDDDSLFFQTLRNFQARYRNGVASAEDFKTVLQETSGRDFTWFFDQWYYGKGFPMFNFTWWQSADSLIILSNQTGSSSETPFFRTKIGFRLVFVDGTDTLLSALQTSNDECFSYFITRNISTVIPDPDNWILDQSTIIELLSDQIVRINPNPFYDELHLEFRTGEVVRQIIISDIQGKIYGQYTSAARMVTLPTRNLIQGVYMITVREGKDNYTLRMIKN